MFLLFFLLPISRSKISRMPCRRRRRGNPRTRERSSNWRRWSTRIEDRCRHCRYVVRIIVLYRVSEAVYSNTNNHQICIGWSIGWVRVSERWLSSNWRRWLTRIEDRCRHCRYVVRIIVLYRVSETVLYRVRQYYTGWVRQRKWSLNWRRKSTRIKTGGYIAGICCRNICIIQGGVAVIQCGSDK